MRMAVTHSNARHSPMQIMAARAPPQQSAYSVRLHPQLSPAAAADPHRASLDFTLPSLGLHIRSQTACLALQLALEDSGHTEVQMGRAMCALA